MDGAGAFATAMRRLARILSRREWGIIRYNAVFQDFAALLYILITFQQYRLTFIGEALVFLLFSTAMTGYGYFVNDLADQVVDHQQGKPNAFHGMARGAAWAITGGFLLAGLLCALPFLARPGFAAALAGWVFCSSAYSLPPLRWKERGALGLAVTVAAQQVLPMLLLFLGLAPVLDWGAGLFLIYAGLRGLSSDLGHQLRDAAGDARTGTQTFAVRAGKRRAEMVYALSLELERMATAVLLVWMTYRIPSIQSSVVAIPFSPIWPLLIGYLFLALPCVGQSWRAYRRGELLNLDPYNEALQTAARDRLHLAHHSFPAVILPLGLCAAAGVYYIPSLVFGLLIGWIFRLYRPEMWRDLLQRRNSLS